MTRDQWAAVGAMTSYAAAYSLILAAGCRLVLWATDKVWRR